MVIKKLQQTEYTKEDWERLEEKYNNPSKNVICPRCGNELIYVETSYSYGAKCKTKNCLSGGIRGI